MYPILYLQKYKAKVDKLKELYKSTITARNFEEVYANSYKCGCEKYGLVFERLFFVIRGHLFTQKLAIFIGNMFKSFILIGSIILPSP